ncbi:MAG: ADP-ribose pyrophosphatase, partial [Desemzia incerta]
MKFEEKTLSKESIYKGNITEYTVESVELPNGKVSTREIVRHPGAVAIMPFTSEGKMIFVEQFRKPIE